MGAILGALAGIGFGLFQALNRVGLRSLNPYETTFAQTLVAGVVLGAVSIVGGQVGRVEGGGAAWGLLWFAIAGTLNWGLGIAFLGLSQRRIGAVRTGPLLATTPLFGTAIAAITLGQTPTVITIVAIGVMVSGVYLASTGQAGAPARVAVGAPSGPGPGEEAPGRHVQWTFVLPGLATAVCWASTPVFISKGLDRIDSPLLGVTVGVLAVVVIYAVGFLVTGYRRSWKTVPPDVLGAAAGAGALVGVSTWALWQAFALAPVGIVLALALLQVPTVMVVAPILSGRADEAMGRRLLVGAGFVVVGALAILLSTLA